MGDERSAGLFDRLVGRCTFPGPGELAVCAVSGGADSMAMLLLASHAKCRVHVVHVDHGLRPTGRQEASLVRRASESVGATFELAEVMVSPGPDLEARARRARYEVLPDGALVAHTADDLAETFLLNLMRGAGLDGLGGMRPAGGGLRKVARPMLGLRRAETLAVCTEAGVEVVSDPSNTDPRFRRNRVRQEVIPLLKDVSGRDPVPLLARTAGLLSRDAGYLSDMAEVIDPTDTRALLAAPKVLATRALRAWLRSSEGPEHHPPSLEELERAWEVVIGRRRACEMAGGRRLSRHRGRLRLDGEGVQPPGEPVL